MKIALAAIALLSLFATAAQAERYCPNRGVVNGKMYCNAASITSGRTKIGADGWARPVKQKVPKR